MSLEKIATSVSSVSAFVLMSGKMITGIMSGSVAVLSSAIDSLLDMFVSIFNYIAVRNAQKPADKQFNYGRGKIEAVAAFAEGLLIFVSGLYILYESLQRFIQKETIVYLEISIWVMGVSFLITIVLVGFLQYVFQKTGNMVIESDVLHYKTDILSTGGILLSLVLISYTGWYILDVIIGGAIGLYILYSSYGIIKKGFLMLLDVSLDQDEVSKIETIIHNHEQVNSYHYLKTRRSGSNKFVEMHLVFTPDIPLLQAHNAADEIILQIKNIDQKSHWDVNVHLDPYDDSKK